MKLAPKAEAIDADMRKNMQASEQMLLVPLSAEKRAQPKELLLAVASHLE